jgi:hypothetical protein
MLLLVVMKFLQLTTNIGFFLGSDNLTKVVMEVLMIGGGLPKNQIAYKFIYFGGKNDNVF